MNNSGPGSRHREALLISLCFAALFLPVVIYPAFPSQDGGAHAYSAWALCRLHEISPLFGRYFYATSPLTNWAATAIMGPLSGIIRPQAVEHGFVIVYVALALAAIVFTTTKLFRSPLGASALFFPLIFSHMLHMGSFNVALATAAFLPFVGTCYLYIESPSWRRAALVGAMLLVIFTLHVQIALLALAYTATCISWMGIHALGNRPPCRLRDAVGLAIAGLPTAAMCVVFAVQSGKMENHAYNPAAGKKLLHLFRMTGIASYSLSGLIVCQCMFVMLAATLICLAIRRNDRSQTHPGGIHCLRAAAIAMFVVYLAVPEGFDDAFNAEERTMVPMLIACLSWVVLRFKHSGRSPAIAAMGLVFVLALSVDRCHAFAAFAPERAEYGEVSAALPDGSAVILVDLDHVADHRTLRAIAHPFAATPRFDATRNLLGSVLAGREVIFASLYEAAGNKPYFAIKYQPWLAGIVADRSMDELAAGQPSDFDAFAKLLRTAPAPVRYLAVWHDYPETEDAERAASFLASVDENYQRVFTSSAGHMVLYRLTGSSPDRD